MECNDDHDSDDDSRIAPINVAQIAEERLLISRPIGSAKQVEITRITLNTCADLGLKSGATPSFEEHLETHVQYQIEREMRRVSQMDVLELQIGSWKRETRFKGHVVAKFFYHTRRMMWEIFEDGVKNKITVQWDDIVAMEFDIKQEEGFGMLQIEVRHSSQTPSFYQEIDPKPREHIDNKIASDFTGGEAMRSRIHTLWFRNVDLDNHYDRLLYYEPQFVKLSESAFPNPQCPCFDPCPCDIGANVSFRGNQNVSQIGQQLNFQDRIGSSTYLEQGEAGKGALVCTGGLADVILQSVAYGTAFKEMLHQKNPDNNYLIEPPPFSQEVPPKQEIHTWEKASDFTSGQALTDHSALGKPLWGILDSDPQLEQMIPFSFPNPEESPFSANLNNVGNDPFIDYNENEPQNNPIQQLPEWLSHQLQYEPMFQCPFSSPKESPDFANLNNAGADTSVDCNGNEPENNPIQQLPESVSHQHHQPRCDWTTQNHENQTTGNQKSDTVESASPPSVLHHSQPSNNNGPRDASNIVVPVHQQTGNSDSWSCRSVEMKQFIDKKNKQAILQMQYNQKVFAEYCISNNIPSRSKHGSRKP